MKPVYLYQIVLCTQRDRRAFRREIAVSGTNALITSVEALPPGYDQAMAMMRRANEQVHKISGELGWMSDYRGCPFCGNMLSYECSCGALSCISQDRTRHHCCPACGLLSEVSWVHHFLASESGFTGGNAPRCPFGIVEREGDEWTREYDARRESRNAPPPVMGLLEASPEDRGKLRAWLMKRRYGK